MIEPLLAFNDVTQILGISKDSLQWFINTKQIKSAKIGKTRKFREEWVNDFIKRRTT